MFNVTHHVRVVGEGGHHVLIGRAHIHPSGHDHRQKFRIAHGLDGVHQARRVRTTHSVRAVADMAVGVVAPEATVTVPVNLPLLHVVRNVHVPSLSGDGCGYPEERGGSEQQEGAEGVWCDFHRVGLTSVDT